MKFLSGSPYTVQFTEKVKLNQPLQPAQVAYLRRLLTTRRVGWRVEQIQELSDPLREAVGLPLGPEGAYFTGLNYNEIKFKDWQPLGLNQNKPPQGQPDLQCRWRITEDETTLEYDGRKQEQLYYCYAWLHYLIEHFFRVWGYTLNGTIGWQGSDNADRGTIVVEESQIRHRLFQDTSKNQLALPNQPIGCVHHDARETKLVCTHIANQDIHWSWGRWFSGHDRDCYLICQQCGEAAKQHGIPPTPGQICWRCYNDLGANPSIGCIVGQPEVFSRSTDLSLLVQSKTLALPARLLDIQPVEAHQESVWMALTHEGQLLEINLTTDTLTPRLTLPTSKLNLDEEITLHIAPGGQYVAVVNTHGQHGLVLDLTTGQVTMELERDDYHIEYCHFPLAFFQDGQRVLLIHGTRWNRLDIADPRTGETLSARLLEEPTADKRPDHYLDYFHGRLSVSPDQQWVVDDGWVWHPVGMVVAWDLQRWLHENPWESEDGPSMMGLCDREWYWNGPLCWINERIVAIWGYGDDDDALIPAVRLFDVVAEQELAWFAGPEGTLVYDEYLFALSEEKGVTAWDIATGERVLAESNFHPTRYHRGAKQFLHSDQQDGKIQVAILVSKG